MNEMIDAAVKEIVEKVTKYNELMTDVSMLVISGGWTEAELAVFLAQWCDMKGAMSPMPLQIIAADGEMPKADPAEKTYEKVISDLGKDRLGKGAVEALIDVAKGSLKRQENARSINRATGKG